MLMERDQPSTYDFTSLLGNDKKQLLRELPTSNTVKKIWKDFRELYTFIGSGHNSDEQITDFFEKAKSWVNLFISLRDKRKGYERARIAPYIHARVFHIPKFFRTHKSVNIFTGQGVEKTMIMQETLHYVNQINGINKCCLRCPKS